MEQEDGKSGRHGVSFRARSPGACPARGLVATSSSATRGRRAFLSSCPRSCSPGPGECAMLGAACWPVRLPELYVKPSTQHPGLCAGGSSRTNGSRYPPLSARRGLPGWLQPASSTSPWLFYQVSSEVFSKSSSVMSSLLLL